MANEDGTEDESTTGGSPDLTTTALEQAREIGEAVAHVNVLAAGHEALKGGLNDLGAVVNDLKTTVDGVVETQAQVLAKLEELKPVTAAEDEVEGDAGVVRGDVDDVLPPQEVKNEPKRKKGFFEWLR